MSSGCWCLAESFLFPRALGATDVRLEARICRAGCGGWRGGACLWFPRALGATNVRLKVRICRVGCGWWRGGAVGDQVPAFSSRGAFDVAGLVLSISDAGVAGRDGFAQE